MSLRSSLEKQSKHKVPQKCKKCIHGFMNEKGVFSVGFLAALLSLYGFAFEVKRLDLFVQLWALTANKHIYK